PDRGVAPRRHSPGRALPDARDRSAAVRALRPAEHEPGPGRRPLPPEQRTIACTQRNSSGTGGPAEVDGAIRPEKRAPAEPPRLASGPRDRHTRASRQRVRDGRRTERPACRRDRRGLRGPRWRNRPMWTRLEPTPGRAARALVVGAVAAVLALGGAAPDI